MVLFESGDKSVLVFRLRSLTLVAISVEGINVAELLDRWLHWVETTALKFVDESEGVRFWSDLMRKT